jgi:hypothetical protein
VGKLFIWLMMALALGCADPCSAQTKLVAPRVNDSPSIDGDCQDAVWIQSREAVTHDAVADLDIRLKAIHTHQDEGDAAHEPVLQLEYRGELIPRFIHESPTGSRADLPLFWPVAQGFD